MKLFLLLSLILLAGLMSAQTLDQAGPQEVKVRPDDQGGDHSCWDLSVKLRHQGLAMDPTDSALVGIEIQARLAKSLFEDDQSC